MARARGVGNAHTVFQMKRSMLLRIVHEIGYLVCERIMSALSSPSRHVICRRGTYFLFWGAIFDTEPRDYQVNLMLFFVV